MFTRTVTKTEIPEAEQMDTDAALCPPHNFEHAWALPQGSSVNSDETVPCLFCTACGDITLLRIPSDAS